MNGIHEAHLTLPTDIFPGQRWTHYKGGEYEIICLAVKEDTMEQVVVYRSLSYGTVWVRDLKVWNGIVETENGPVHRFRPGSPVE
jgi:hypothetical protein